MTMSNPGTHLAPPSSSPKPNGSFPMFDNGNVVIQSKLASSYNQTMQLHGAILTQHSPYFSRTIKLRACAWHYFTIESSNDGQINLISHDSQLSNRPVTNALEPCHATLIDGVKIKLEDEDSEIKPESKTGTEVEVNATRSYTQVLALFYDIQLSSFPHPVAKVLGIAERLVQTSIELECLPIVRPHLGKLLGEYRHDLFVAIKNDPPRWIKLGEALENKSIYAECLVHMVGTHLAISRQQHIQSDFESKD